MECREGWSINVWIPLASWYDLKFLGSVRDGEFGEWGERGDIGDTGDAGCCPGKVGPGKTTKLILSTISNPPSIIPEISYRFLAKLPPPPPIFFGPDNNAQFSLTTATKSEHNECEPFQWILLQRSTTTCITIWETNKLLGFHKKSPQQEQGKFLILAPVLALPSRPSSGWHKCKCRYVCACDCIA